MKHILFLYTEIADYFISCCEYLSQDYKITIVRWPINKEAPFNFTSNSSITILEKNNNWSEVEDQLKKIDFNLIITSGWLDKDYLKLTKAYKKKGVPTVITLDNHWQGSLKQNIARILAPFTLKNIFTYAWVPGKPQKEYAQKLGFKKDHIFENFYCANEKLFTENFKNSNSKYEPLKKRFIYVGRYMQHKGVFDLWEAYIKLRKEGTEWELWCLGTGDEWENRIEHDGIKHFGFIQPDQLPEILSECTIFILPSHFEPWGVVVHENAISGFPMILSNKIGAHTRFLDNKKNGLLFESQNVNDLFQKMKHLSELSPQELKEMGKRSHEIGTSLGFEQWASCPRKILGDKLT